MEIVPDDIPDKDLREEVNRRTFRAGYTTREGKPVPLKIMTTVPFGEVRLNIWPRDKNGKLIDE
jgi:hypothetical protein